MKDIAAKYGQSARDASSEGKKNALVYHTFFAEYKGDTPEEVIAQIHEDSRDGTDMDFSAWWKYQQKIWGAKYGLDVPEKDSKDAAQGMLNVLLKVGAIEHGPRAGHEGTLKPDGPNG